MPSEQSKRVPWTRQEIILAMNLYCRIPFGRQHGRAPEVIELANRLRRTPGSVAMKLNNLTSLDPAETARGVKGLPGASSLDRQVWREFHANWETMAAESEALWDSVVVQGISLDASEPQRVANGEEGSPTITKIRMPGKDHVGPTEGERTVLVRYAQNFFRRAVLAAYDVRCCISGNPVPELLVASHILPWSECPEQRVNPRNGLCLSRLHDAAFDRHLITLDEDYRVVISKSLRDYLPNATIQTNFAAFEGIKISLPEKFLPDPAFLRKHRDALVQS